MKKHNIPTVFALFGVTGDLAQQKIFPALVDLYEKGYLPDSFAIVGIARREMTEEQFRTFVGEAIQRKRKCPQDVLDGFLKQVAYVQGQLDETSTYEAAKEVCSTIDAEWGVCANKLFYLSVPPTLYETIITQLSNSGIAEPCHDGHGWTRILIEKPFGEDVATAQKLDALLGKRFDEGQIYRIDHYLAKHTIQNIMAFRFLNTLFEPLWDREHIERVDIELYEEATLGTRGGFYDTTGALRDVGQNHVLQMLALIAMEQPEISSVDDIRRARAAVFEDLYVSKRTKDSHMVRGQYEGYTDTDGVAQGSETETFFSFTAHVNNRRWKGVPFCVSSGKGLSESRVRIVVQFKDQTKKDFFPKQHEKQECNQITMDIQPEEAIRVLFWVRMPGFEDRVEAQELSFSFSDTTGQNITAYEKVLFDCITGDQTLFTSTSEVTRAWDFITHVRRAMEQVLLQKYAVGSSPSDIMNTEQI